MRIDSASACGKVLVGLGVTEDELRAVKLFRWDFQLGDAITVALPGRRAVILMKNSHLRLGDDGQLAVGWHLSLLRHEMCHVRQALGWGFLRYWRTHLLARVTSRSVSARETDCEKPCYEVQRNAREANSALAMAVLALAADDNEPTDAIS
ncbi:MAG: hypothetical protein WD208_05890 [Dehalococcoidia bacterium]